MNLATLLKQRIEAKGFEKLVHFHRALLNAGVQISYSAVHAWTSGDARIGLEHIPAVVEVLGLDDEDRLALHELPLARKSKGRAA